MILKTDIVIDQIGDEYQISLYDEDTGLVVCQVFGSTIEEVEERAEIIENAVNTYGDV